MSTSEDTGGNGPDQRSHVEELVMIANAVIGGVGTVYTATESIAALALGGMALVWLVVLLMRGHDR